MQQEQQEGQIAKSGMASRQTNGGHELLDADEAIGTVISCLEQFVLYEQQAKDQELLSIIQRQKAYLSQVYNTVIDTLKTGLDPKTPTQTYNIETMSDITYGMKPSQAKSPAQTVNEITDECLSTFIMNNLKLIATSFTTTALETTNPVLRRVFADSIPNIIELAYEIFLYQNRKGYYEVALLQEQEMQMIKNGYTPTQPDFSH